MSDEEDGEDNQAGSWVVRSPPWRSPQLSSLCKRLQEKVDSRPSSPSHPKNARVQGPPSTRPPPPSSPAWTVNSNRRQGHQRTHTPSPSSFLVTPSPPPQSPSPTCSQGEEHCDEDLLQAEDIWRVLDQDPPVHRHRRCRHVFMQDSDSES